MAGQPVVTALSGIPELSSFVAAIKQADLTATFDSSRDITVFAPVNDAFDKVPTNRLDKLLDDREALVGFLGYHVVQGRKSPADLADATLTTMQTGTITTEATRGEITVNDDAEVLCPNIQTANATVYLLDAVLRPPG